MASLDEAQWLALRKEWEIGVLSEQALAEKYGIDRKQIQRRKKREAWVPDPGTRNVIAIEAARSLREQRLQELSQRPGSGTPKPVPELSQRPSPGQRPDTRLVPRPSFTPELAAKLDEIGKRQAVEDAFAIISKTSERHLRLTQKLHTTFEYYHTLLEEILIGDEAAAAQAAARLLSGRNDSVSSAIQTLVRTAEAIQTIERRALGLEAPAKGGKVGEMQDTGLLTNDAGMPVIDVSILSDEQLAMLQRAAAIMDQASRDALPLPPKGPVIDE